MGGFGVVAGLIEFADDFRALLQSILEEAALAIPRGTLLVINTLSIHAATAGSCQAVHHLRGSPLPEDRRLALL